LRLRELNCTLGTEIVANPGFISDSLVFFNMRFMS